MKTLLRALILPICIILFTIHSLSCNQTVSSNNNNLIEPRIGNFTIKTIDSCEYIEYDYGIGDNRVYELEHKGNCKFCEARKNKQ